ncbi:hypothetical protein [Pararhodobacter sp. CCB-MM2]|uniref:hypothetical protein n=1 Tax=Pararhodobacter sp. CCB-MM2 TaxID=1786003 RepID=UPI001112525F|nr:hypothetical protein [Pararhodobacter sp. CCB-MM2]
MPNLSDLLGGGGGGSGITVGSNYANGTASATIVNAGANPNGVLICTASICFGSVVAINNTFTMKILSGSSILIEARGARDNGMNASSLSGIIVPAGESLSVETDTSAAVYHITYEVL